MSEPSKSIWYRLGYAVESARQGSQSARQVRSAGRARPVQEARSEEEGGRAEAPSTANGRDEAMDPTPRPVSSAVEQLIATGTAMLGDRVISIVLGQRPGTIRLTRAALAGAGAALALSLLRNGKNGAQEAEPHRDPTAELLSGAAKGMLYGAVLEPRLPGSPLLRGATFGVMEYVASPFGGLEGILGASSPHRTMPILAALLGPSEGESGPQSMIGSMTDHVAFGVTLGLLYGEGRASKGRRAAE